MGKYLSIHQFKMPSMALSHASYPYLSYCQHGLFTVGNIHMYI